MEFTNLLVVALAVEALVEYFVKDAPFTPNKITSYILRYTSALIGVAFAYNFDIDIFYSLGMTSHIPYFGVVVTGLLAGRGANYLNEFISTIINLKNTFKISDSRK